MAGEGDDNGKSDLKLEEHPAFKEMQKTVNLVAKVSQNLLNENKQLKEQFTSIGEKLDNLGSSTPKNKTVNTDGDDDGNPGDINDMDNAELTKYIISEVKKVVGNEVKPIKDEFDKSMTSMTAREMKKEIEAFAEKTPQFWHLASEIKELAENNQNLTIPQLYTLARQENPEKAEEADKKVSEDKGDDESKDKKPNSFGGLTPTSGAKPAGSSDEKLDESEASEAAWNDLVNNLGDDAEAVLGDAG